jgi:cell division protein FtsB
MAALISLGIAKHAANQRVNELQQQTQALAQENEQLREDISQLGTLESIQKIAREVLDLVMPGTVFFNTGD